MKIRNSFVANSSSSSFLLVKAGSVIIADDWYEEDDHYYYDTPETSSITIDITEIINKLTQAKESGATNVTFQYGGQYNG